MSIRKASLCDFDAIFEMVKEFNAASDYSGIEVDRDSCIAIVAASINQGMCFVVDDLSGFIVGLCMGAPMNQSVLMATELAWWVKPSARGGSSGVKLLKEFERAAKANGAKMISMMCLESMKANSVESLYERMGYAPTERAYVRAL